MTSVRLNSVLPDANIWCSQTLHSWFGLLAAETVGSWTFHWTEDILAEAIYSRRKRFPLAPAHQIDSVRDRLMTTMGDNRISRFSIDDSVEYSDVHDAHVHSAAVHAGISIIATDDRTGFDGLYDDTDDCPYEVYTADDFLILAAETSAPTVDAVIRCQLAYWMKKGRSFSLPKKLEKAQAPAFAEYVRGRLQQIELP